MMYTVHNGSHYCLFCFQILEILQHTKRTTILSMFPPISNANSHLSAQKITVYQIVSTRLDEAKVDQLTKLYKIMTISCLFLRNRGTMDRGIIIFNLFESERVDRRTVLVFIQWRTWVAINWVTGSCYQALLSTSVHLSCPINKSFDIPSTGEI